VAIVGNGFKESYQKERRRFSKFFKKTPEIIKGVLDEKNLNLILFIKFLCVFFPLYFYALAFYYGYQNQTCAYKYIFLTSFGMKYNSSWY